MLHRVAATVAPQSVAWPRLTDAAADCILIWDVGVSNVQKLEER